MKIQRTAFAIVACAVFVLSETLAASAHTHLVRATPAVDGTVRAAPSEVTLRSVLVRDSDGKQVDKGNAQLDKSDRRIMRVALPPLMPGVYKVEWRAVSADTHKVEGDFTFRVGQ